MKKIFFTAFLFTVGAIHFLFAQNVGIGTSSPNYKLDVVGIIHSSDDSYFDGFVGIGTTSPNYKLQVNNGAIAIYNTTDLKTWSLNYSSSSNTFNIAEGASTRFSIANGGNVGIGVSAPAVKLDVAGSGNFTGNLDVDGSLTVNAGSGIVRNTSATQLKVLTFNTLEFVAILGPNQLSGEGSIAFGGGFTTTPRVFVGAEALSGGTSGELHRVQLILYNCNTNSCKARLLNTSPASVNYSIYWNIMCIGN